MNEAVAPTGPNFPAAADRVAGEGLIASFAALGRAEARFARSETGMAALECLGGNAPYLGELALREPATLMATLSDGPVPTLAAIMAALRAIDPQSPRNRVARGLREGKRRAALAIAVADLGGLWRLEQVTAALSDLADASISAALRHLLRTLHDARTIILPAPDDPERGSQFAVLGMGKLGARELNYSSDIDLMLLFDPSSPVYREDAQAAMARLARDFVTLMSERDSDGTVFRVDLRLRPDPAATPPVVNLAAALTYYESQGRTWERAALSKARPVAGDVQMGAEFLDQIRPFVWRRNLDFAAIAEIHDMKRRIDRRHRDQPGAVVGRNVKLGRGGIREIEFIVQTLSLVWGGHEPVLRVAGTLGSLRALATARHLPAQAARQLADDYRELRRIEHRLQMVDDRQTHSLPATPEGMARFGVFAGEPDLLAFEAVLDRLFERVHSHFAAFFDAGIDAGIEGGSAFEVGDEGAVPERFSRDVVALGFRDGRHLAERLRAWRSGTLPALRTARSRELLDAIVPTLLKALSRQADPDAAFRRFDQMLERQRAGIPLLSLFERNPALLDRLATVLGSSPPLSEHLAAYPGALDALLAPVARFSRPAPVLRRLLRDASDLEDSATTLRRFVRREEFHLSVASLERRLDVDRASDLRSSLARAALAVLLPLVMADVQRRFGRLPGARFGIVAFGRVGAGEMQPGSDLDLMMIYDHPEHAQVKPSARLSASQYFIRLAHAMIGAVTARGAEGPIYAVDMRLRPSGNTGPVAVSLAAFRHYHADQAWTWERLALTRARVMTATRGFAPVIEAGICEALCRSVAPSVIRADTVAMRARLARDAPAQGDFDLKHRRGGTMELGFIVEALQLIHGPVDPALFRPCTREAVAGLAAKGAIGAAEAEGLIAADHLFRTIQAMMRITGLTAPSPASAPGALAPLLAATGADDIAALTGQVEAAAALVHTAFRNHLGDPDQPIEPKGHER